MKEGDEVVRRYRELEKQRKRMGNWLKAVSSPFYVPDWIYWLDYLRANKN